jgi:hypothetical protein
MGFACRTDDDPDWLDRLELTTPCPKTWESMRGSDRVRFCDACSLNVYDLSALTRREAEQLVASREGRLCATFLRREDGTVVTRDCLGGVAALVRRRAVAAAGWFLAFFGVSSALGGFLAPEPQRPHTRVVGIDPRVTAKIR